MSKNTAAMTGCGFAASCRQSRSRDGGTASGLHRPVPALCHLTPACQETFTQLITFRRSKLLRALRVPVGARLCSVEKIFDRSRTDVCFTLSWGEGERYLISNFGVPKQKLCFLQSKFLTD